MINFRTYTVLFFLILASINLASIFGCSDTGCFFCTHTIWFYLILVALYLVVAVAMAFIPCSNFHHTVYCAGKTRDRAVALTFDDGPDTARTPMILDILRSEQVAANFFLVGKKLGTNETLVQRIVSEGHLVGNHSWSHSYWFDLFPAKKMTREFNATKDEVQRITGKKPLMIRPPYGVVNPMVARAARKTGSLLIGWSIRSLDTVKKNHSKIGNNVFIRLKPGAVLLFHDTTSFSADSLRPLIQEIKRRGYTFVLLDQLLNLPAYE